MGRGTRYPGKRHKLVIPKVPEAALIQFNSTRYLETLQRDTYEQVF